MNGNELKIWNRKVINRDANKASSLDEFRISIVLIHFIGAYFVTIKDVNTIGNMKMDKASFNMITILRHLKRLKETRHANNLIHYVII